MAELICFHLRFSLPDNSRTLSPPEDNHFPLSKQDEGLSVCCSYHWPIFNPIWHQCYCGSDGCRAFSVPLNPQNTARNRQLWKGRPRSIYMQRDAGWLEKLLKIWPFRLCYRQSFLKSSALTCLSPSPWLTFNLRPLLKKIKCLPFLSSACRQYLSENECLAVTVLKSRSDP